MNNNIKKGVDVDHYTQPGNDAIVQVSTLYKLDSAEVKIQEQEQTIAQLATQISNLQTQLDTATKGTTFVVFATKVDETTTGPLSTVIESYLISSVIDSLKTVDWVDGLNPMWTDPNTDSYRTLIVVRTTVPKTILLVREMLLTVQSTVVPGTIEVVHPTPII